MRSKIYIYIIIIFGILALIMIQLSTNMELFDNINQRGTDFDYRNIDRISNGNEMYSYCIGGNITCRPLFQSEPIKIKDDYTGGNTYESYCMTNGVVDISNNVYCDGTVYDSLNLRDRPTNVLPLTKTSFPISTEYKGFTIPYSYIPAKIDSTDKNRLNFLKENGNVIEYNDICNLYYSTDSDNCRKELEYGNTLPKQPGIPDPGEYDPNDIYSLQSSTSQSQQSSTSQKTSLSQSSTSQSQQSSTSGIVSSITSYIKEKVYPPTDCDTKILCRADFGTNIGDALCCGQLGHLENTDYICPSVKPKCSNFDCKTQFGYCQ